jgi:hypothetical protein
MQNMGFSLEKAYVYLEIICLLRVRWQVFANTPFNK